MASEERERIPSSYASGRLSTRFRREDWIRAERDDAERFGLRPDTSAISLSERCAKGNEHLLVMGL